MEDTNLTEATNNPSRRNFIKGVIAAGAAVSSASYLFRTSALGQGEGAGSADRLISLSVNGQERRVDVMKQETLAQTLRYKLGLTGTKLGCDRAECGACTVLIDDVPHYACSVLTHTVRTKKIVRLAVKRIPEVMKNADGYPQSDAAGHKPAVLGHRINSRRMIPAHSDGLPLGTCRSKHATIRPGLNDYRRAADRPAARNDFPFAIDVALPENGRPP